MLISSIQQGNELSEICPFSFFMILVRPSVAVECYQEDTKK